MLILVLISAVTLGSGLKSDEIVRFFPQYGYLSADTQSWIINFHAWVYELEEDSRSRTNLLTLFANHLGLEAEQSESETFKNRALLFIADNERGKEIEIRLNRKTYKLGPSVANGHIFQVLTVSSAGIDSVVSLSNPKEKRIKIEVVHPAVKERSFTFSVPLIDDEGISVISDIDDTIKISEVTDKRALLANTFLKEFNDVPGMSKLYRSWSEQGASFHYVSATPWQLYPSLQHFLDSKSFPSGSLSLKTFRWKDSSFFDLFANSAQIKKPFIESILKSFPKRKFILVGDTGEVDPELYSDIAGNYPAQVARILIRNSTKEPISSARWSRVFGHMARDSWMVFDDPTEIEQTIDPQFFKSQE